MTSSSAKKALVQNIQFGEVHDEPLPPELFAYGLTLYIRVRQAYENANQPLGPSDEAMLIWFTFEEDLLDHVSVPSNP